MKLFYVSLILVVSLFTGIIITTGNVTSDNGDGMWHYLLARYCYENPIYLLDLWGKPMFTFLASPFAQFGFKGVHFFQLLCSLISSWSCYKIAQKFNLSFKPLLPVLILFVPVYFPMVLSSMTEILFSTVAIGTVALFVYGHYWSAAIVLSFLPFCRQEGYLFLPGFALVFILTRKFKYLLGLPVGSMVLSIIGFFAFGDLFWIKNKHPYSDVAMYGHGELLHYVYASYEMFGPVYSYLLAFGLITMLYYSAKNIRKIFIANEEQVLVSTKIIFLVGIPLGYFVMHSVVWYLGKSGSLGLHRIMSCIIPFAALMILDALTYLNPYLLKVKYLKWGVFAGLFCLISVELVSRNYVPIKLNAEEVVVNEASNWIKSNQLQSRNFHYSHPYIIGTFGFNPHTSQQYRTIPRDANIRDVAKKTDLVIWDGHFGPNECTTPLSSLKDTSYFKELLHKVPEYPFKTLGGYDFEVYVFERK